MRTQQNRRSPGPGAQRPLGEGRSGLQHQQGRRGTADRPANRWWSSTARWLPFSARPANPPCSAHP